MPTDPAYYFWLGVIFLVALASVRAIAALADRRARKTREAFRASARRLDDAIGPDDSTRDLMTGPMIDELRIRQGWRGPR